MILIFDSNILIGNDYLLTSQEKRVLLNLIQAGKVEVHLPKIVLEEVLDHYKQDLKSNNDRLSGAFTWLKRNVIGYKSKTHKDIELKNSVKLYKEFLLDKLDVSNDRIIENDFEDYQRVTKDLIDKAPPFFNNEKKKEYKDALIWRCVFKVACENIDNKVMFLCENKSDFGINRLFNELESELNEKGIIVGYLNSLDEFMKQNSTLAIPIPENDVNQFFSKEAIETELTNLINQNYLSDFAKRMGVQFYGRQYGSPEITKIEITSLKLNNPRHYKNDDVVSLDFASTDIELNVYGRMITPAQFNTTSEQVYRGVTTQGIKLYETLTRNAKMKDEILEKFSFRVHIECKVFLTEESDGYIFSNMEIMEQL